jgi:hypothetical protein
MMDFIWFCLGLLTTGSIFGLWTLSSSYRMNGLGWLGTGTGIFLVLFTIAWSAGSILEGVPRAASMGLVLFGLPGISLLVLSLKFIDTRLEKTGLIEDEVQPADELPCSDLPKLPLPGAVQLSRLGAVVRSSICYLAYASLFIAFLIGISGSEKDYETMVKVKFPDVPLAKINADPVVFELGEKVDGKGNYVVITEGQGYGGPLVIGVRIMDDAVVHEVMLLDDRETPAFLDKIKKADFAQRFEGKHVTDNFLPGDDIDTVSGATISTAAGAQAIRTAAHVSATQYFKLPASWKKEPWKIGLDEILLIGIFVLAFVPKVYARKPWSYVYMALVVAVVGFYLNASITIGSLSGLLMGFIPGIKAHLVWWLLVPGTIAAIAVTGKNIYCFRICPFYGVQYILGKIGGGKLKPSPGLLKHTKTVSGFLLWLSLMIIFLSAHPALGAYEPFAMMFSLNGEGIQWFILPFALIGSLFTSTFWCRFFCPCGNALARLVRWRGNMVKRLRRKNDA